MVIIVCLFVWYFVYSGLWGVVNNAGVWYAAELEMTPDHLFKRVMDVNLMGAVAVTKAFMPLLRQAKGRIVNMTSVAGEFILSMVR